MPIDFWRTSDEHGWGSNFYRAPFVLDGKEWKTSEHYFQAMKYKGQLRESIIREAPNPMEAARLGRDRDFPIRRDWDRVKEDVMVEALMAKFTQNKPLREKLLSTGDEVIREVSPVDDYWGTGADGSGKNRLGILLMHVRDALRRDQITQNT